VSPSLAVVGGIYAAASVATFAAFAHDKRRAVRADRRVPERTLHALTVFGALGALAAIFGLRHKTKKPGFLALTALATLVHVGLVGAALRLLLS